MNEKHAAVILIQLDNLIPQSDRQCVPVGRASDSSSDSREFKPPQRRPLFSPVGNVIA